MSEKHLTVEDIEKYMDTSDLSEEYLLWMEHVMEHLSGCPRCQEVLQKSMMIDIISDDGNFADALILATKEEDIRREVVITKLQQMSEYTRMTEVIRKLREQAINPVVLQMTDLQRRAGVARGGEKHTQATQLPENVEITTKDESIIVKITEQDSKGTVTVLLDRKGLEPELCETVWNESEQCMVAEFSVSDSNEPFEIYVIR